MASDETNLNLPLVVNSMDALRPLLTYLAQLYGIDMVSA